MLSRGGGGPFPKLGFPRAEKKWKAKARGRKKTTAFQELRTGKSNSLSRSPPAKASGWGWGKTAWKNAV